MRSYLALIKIQLRLAARERAVLFFNYLLPLLFFFLFGQVFRAGSGGIETVVTTVLVIGIGANGLFGVGLRSIQERETNVLRRYKVAPISPLHMVVSSMVSGLVLYLPSVLLTVGLACAIYKMAFPPQIVSFLVFVMVSILAFRAIGSIIAATANSAGEGNIIVQLVWTPMLFLSGATFPLSFMPDWVQSITQFVPATYLMSGLRGILQRKETLLENLAPVGALILTGVTAAFIATKLFRWEKEEKLPGTAKLWVLAVFLPFIALGVWQNLSHDTLLKSKQLDRDMRRNRARILRNVRIELGDGRTIESGYVYLKDGKIAAVGTGSYLPADSKPEEYDLAGKTVLPALLDLGVQLSAPGGVPADPAQMIGGANLQQPLMAYLYSGVAAVLSAGDSSELAKQAQAAIHSGRVVGADVTYCGPVLTVADGPGTEMVRFVPQQFRQQYLDRTLRIVTGPGAVEPAVAALAQAGASCVIVALDGTPHVDQATLQAIQKAAAQRRLPVWVRTATNQQVLEAAAIKPAVFVGAVTAEPISAAAKAALQATGATVVSALSAIDVRDRMARRDVTWLERPLLMSAAPKALLSGTKAMINNLPPASGATPAAELPTAQANLQALWAAGTPIAAGSAAGKFGVMHGPAIQREVALLVQAGLPAKDALLAATKHAARLVGADRYGLLATGRPASLLVVEGDPGKDITVLERIVEVFLDGERIDRDEVLGQR